MSSQGDDKNIISRKLWHQIRKIVTNIKSTVLNPEDIYLVVTEDLCLTCDENVILDIFLKIRHGLSLILKNVEWKIDKEDIPVPIIGRKELEYLGCDDRELLIAARDKYGEEIDVACRLKLDGTEEESSGK